MHSVFSWTEFWILTGVGYIGLITAIPQAITVFRGLSKMIGPGSEADEFLTELIKSLGLEIFQIPLAAGIGLLCAHIIGLGAPLLESYLVHRPIEDQFEAILRPALSIGLGLGILGSLLNVLKISRRISDKSHFHMQVNSLWEALLSSLHSGIVEEFIYRLLGISFTAWLLSRIWHTSAGQPTSAVFGVILILAGLEAAIRSVGGMIILFKTLDYKDIPVLYVSGVFVLNLTAGIAFSYLFWQYGFEAAIIAHLGFAILQNIVSIQRR